MAGPAPVTTGYNYFGSVAQVIAMGPCDILHEIRNGDTVIFTGPVFRSESMDGSGKTTLATKIGTLRFYWGTGSQIADPLLSAITIDQGNGSVVAPMPDYRHLIYCVGQDIKFGNQTTPPTLQFVMSKFPNALALTGRVTRVRVVNAGTGYSNSFAVTFTGGGGTGATATATAVGGKIKSILITNHGSGYTSAPAVVVTAGGGTGGAATAYTMHERDGDAIIPEVLFDFLRNGLFGSAFAAEDFDTASWIEAAETVFAEDFTASPLFDGNESLRDIVGKLLSYVDGFMFVEHGKLFMKLIRKVSTIGLLSLDEDDLVEEPESSNEGYGETWNITLLTFIDRSNLFEEGTEPYDEAANAAIVGARVEKSVNFPFVGRRSVAKKLAKLIGVRNGIPPVFYTLSLLPKHRNVVPGQVVLLSYAKLGLVNKPCRVMERTVSGGTEPDVQLRVLVEQTRDTSLDYVPPDDFFSTAPFLDASGRGDFTVTPTVVRLATLPTALKDGKADGFLAAFHRTDSFIKRAKINWTWNPGIQAYKLLFQRTQFPAFGQVLFWHRVRQTNWLIRIRLNAAHDYNTITEVGGVASPYYGVFGQRNVRIGISDSHNIAGQWAGKVEAGYFAPNDALTFDIEVKSAEFGTDPFTLETAGAASKGPAANGYFGRLDDFAIHTTDQINFDRNAANALPNPQNGVNPDTDLKRYVKVQCANHKNEEALGDAAEANFDRNDTTMSASGTYSPDWGARAMTGYEYVDTFVGQGFDIPTDTAYLNVDDADEALGDIFHAEQNDTQFLLWEDVDRVLGNLYDRNDGIYNDVP